MAYVGPPVPFMPLTGSQGTGTIGAAYPKSPSSTPSTRSAGFNLSWSSLSGVPKPLPQPNRASTGPEEVCTPPAVRRESEEASQPAQEPAAEAKHVAPAAPSAESGAEVPTAASQAGLKQVLKSLGTGTARHRDPRARRRSRRELALR